MSDIDKLAKSNQTQATAAWVNYLNQLRLDTLLSAFRQQDANLVDALASIDDAIRTIDLEVVEANLGGVKGMHGFIAEVAEVGVGNARSEVLGGGTIYEWVNNNGPADLLRDGVAIQQQFYQVEGRFGLGAIADHHQKYPNFVAQGGRYQIPRDHYEVIRQLYEMSPGDAMKSLSRSGDGPSLKNWERIHEFFDEGSIGIDSLEASKLDYREVQRGTYDSTLQAETESIRSTDQALREDAYRASRPKLEEGAKVALAAAALEGGTAFVLAVAAKRRDGTKLKDFTGADWVEIAGETGFGVVRGGVRGLSIYALTNVTATSAAVASSLVTAAFGIAQQANKLRRGEIDELAFLENAELVSVEAAVSGLSSLMGQALIPVPVLGAVIGNTVGMVMHSVASSSLSRREAELIERYLAEQHALDEQLATEYQELIDRLDASMAEYLTVLERAFSPDVEAALLGSVQLALHLGVAADEILDSDQKIQDYFLG